jgi:hypothetical protein
LKRFQISPFFSAAMAAGATLSPPGYLSTALTLDATG